MQVLRDGDARMCIRCRGAEPVVWKVGEHDLLWRGGPGWSRSSPVLFPIVGRVHGGVIRVQGRSYAMGAHGFASSQEFEIVEQSPSSIRFRLTDNPQTRAQYPFAFRLDVSYRLQPRSFEAAFEVSNPGSEPLPFAVGFHPGFRWPFAGGECADYAMIFSRRERKSVPVITEDGLFARGRRPVPSKGGRMPLSRALVEKEALCFLDAHSRRLRFVAPDGPAIAIETEAFPHFALWSRPPAEFLCIEAWTGHGDPEGYSGELSEKPSMRLLEPGGRSRHVMRWRFEEEVRGWLPWLRRRWTNLSGNGGGHAHDIDHRL